MQGTPLEKQAHAIERCTEPPSRGDHNIIWTLAFALNLRMSLACS
jgi:hypothetical protein